MIAKACLTVLLTCATPAVSGIQNKASYTSVAPETVRPLQQPSRAAPMVLSGVPTSWQRLRNPVNTLLQQDICKSLRSMDRGDGKDAVFAPETALTDLLYQEFCAG